MRITIKNPFVFVLMPFKDDLRDEYDEGIEAACEDVGFRCERSDKQLFDENIVERVHGQIAEADIVVADMTGKNPNVYYEVGYARALDKTVVLLTQDADDIPFDLQQYPHIIYHEAQSLRRQLVNKLRHYAPEPRPVPVASSITPFFLINSMSGMCADVKRGSSDDGVPVLQYPIHGGANQLWRLHPAGEGLYKIVSHNSERDKQKCLTVSAAGGGAGAADAAGGGEVVEVVQQEYDGRAAQKWLLRGLNDGTYQIINSETEKGLAVPALEAQAEARQQKRHVRVARICPLVQLPCTDRSHMRWRIMLNINLD